MSCFRNHTKCWYLYDMSCTAYKNYYYLRMNFVPGIVLIPRNIKINKQLSSSPQELTVQ